MHENRKQKKNFNKNEGDNLIEAIESKDKEKIFFREKKQKETGKMEKNEKMEKDVESVKITIIDEGKEYDGEEFDENISLMCGIHNVPLII